MNQTTIEAFIQVLRIHHCDVQENIPLKGYTSLQIGGKARLLSEPSTIREIQIIIRYAREYQIPFFVLGNGSNILVSDQGYTGLAIITPTNLTAISLVNQTTIVAQAGISLADVCMFAYQHSLTGLEFAWGIPASVGGATFMNAGAYGGEIKDVLHSCTFLDQEGNIQTLENHDLNFSYRHSYFTDKNVIVLEAVFTLEVGVKETIKAKMDDLLARRKHKQPLEYPSAGSTFKRPEGNYASALIEQSGMKGYKHGNAMVSDKHAGFVINHNNATSEEFLELIAEVKRVVKEKTGYELECEVRMIGMEEL